MRPGLALIEPEIAGNVGAILRTAACFECAVHIVEPCGFPFSDRSLRRSGMDYAQRVTVHRHAALDPFVAEQRRLGRRIILATTRGATCYTDFAFAVGDIICLGSESKGAPEALHALADAAIQIPMAPGCRSLNVSVAGGIILSEALRQTMERTA